MVEMYIDRKHGREEVIYDHPNLEPILQNTNGVIVYQEQVMQISQVMAGYSLGGADMLRRAMGKKKPEEMAKQRDIFVTGATDQGIDEVTSGGVFDLMEKFAGYGFNRSHSAAYGVLAYQTAYLKQYYPAEFMAAVLTSDMNNTDNVVFFINDCRENFGLTVDNPSVNRSEWHFVADTPTNIIYGLGAIKGVGEGAVESIVEARRLDGPFTDLYDFCRRVDIKKVNKRTLEALVSAGCFDDFAATLRPDLPSDAAYEIRGALMSQLPSAVQAAEQDRKNGELGMMDLFGEMDSVVAAPPLKMTPELIWGDKHRLKAEKNTLGLYLTGHPINEYLDELKRYTSGTRLNKLTDTGYNGSCYFAGLIIDIANFGNRNVITLDDGTSRLEVSCYAERFNRVKEQLKVDEVVIIKGSIRERDGRLFARLDNALTMVDARLRWLKKISIKVHHEDLNLLARLQPLLKSAQADIIPAPRLSHYGEDDELEGGAQDYYDSAMGASLYDEDGNDLMALDTNAANTAEDNFTSNDGVINDNCTPLGLSVYADYGIANVGLSEHWRVYPNDDNLQQLKTMISDDNLHFHYN
jgi:DNA polymerase-3 subunit alpha